MVPTSDPHYYCTNFLFCCVSDASRKQDGATWQADCGDVTIPGCADTTEFYCTGVVTGTWVALQRMNTDNTTIATGIKSSFRLPGGHGYESGVGTRNLRRALPRGYVPIFFATFLPKYGSCRQCRCRWHAAAAHEVAVCAGLRCDDVRGHCGTHDPPMGIQQRTGCTGPATTRAAPTPTGPRGCLPQLPGARRGPPGSRRQQRLHQQRVAAGGGRALAATQRVRGTRRGHAHGVGGHDRDARRGILHRPRVPPIVQRHGGLGRRARALANAGCADSGHRVRHHELLPRCGHHVRGRGAHRRS